MTEDKWIKVLQDAEKEAVEKIGEELEKEQEHLSTFRLNIEKLNRILKNYNCHFSLPEFSNSKVYFLSSLNRPIHKGDLVKIFANISKSPITYECDGDKFPMIENNKRAWKYESKEYEEFDKLIDDFIEAYKMDLIIFKNLDEVEY